MNQAIKALITKLIEARENEIKELRNFLETINETPEPIIEEPTADFLAKGSNILARILKNGDELQILPIESLQIKANDKAIQWLQNKIFQKASEKHGFKYQFIAEKDMLQAIKVQGINEEEKDKLLNATKWALEKAADRAVAN